MQSTHPAMVLIMHIIAYPVVAHVAKSLFACEFASTKSKVNIDLTSLDNSTMHFGQLQF
jgi:hypothetical protein